MVDYIGRFTGNDARLRKDLDMICTKCNSEVPNGAKFCPVCGNACGTAFDVKPAVAPPEPETKTYCEKCGLELRQGAKFCAVCGTPAAGVKNIKPTENNGATFGQGDMSAVSLSKPNESDSLVAAMNTAAAAPSAAPMPSNDVPVPSNSVPTPSNSIPMPANNGSGFSSGISGSSSAGFSPAPSAPAFIPESPAPMGGQGAGDPFGDMGAAAIVATPIKKKNGAKIGLIIAIVVAVILAAGAIFFFTNKATALSLVMGKPKYATMVEGNSIKNVTEKLDTPAISEGIKSASSFAALMSSMNGGADLDDITGIFQSNTNGGASAVPMMSVSGSSVEGVDFKSAISAYHQALMDAYGVNSVKVSLSANAQISDSVKSLIGSSDVDIDELLDIINNSTITYGVSASDSAMAADFGAASGSAKVNVKAIINENGEFYLSLPFVSDTAFKVKLPTSETSAAPTAEVKQLELDEKEISRIIGELVEVYLEKYKESAIEMESGELSAAGLQASGKLITAEFSGKELSGLFRALAEHFAEDEYFSEKIVEFANDCGADITVKDFKDAVSKVFETDAEKSDKLIISTVIDNNGNVLAKSFKAKSDQGNTELVYVDSKEQFTLEVTEGKKTLFSLVHDITSDSDGSFTFKCSDGSDGNITVKLKYNDIGTAKFCGKDTLVGKYTVSVEVPEDFTQNSDNDFVAAAGALSNVTLTFSSAVNGENTLESTVGAEAGTFGKISVKSSVTAENDDSALKAPSDIIDLGDGSGSGLDQKVENQLKDYLKKLAEKLQDISDSPFGGIIGDSGIIEGIGGITADKASPDDILGLTSSISQLMSRVGNLSTQYHVTDSELSDRRSDLVNDLYKLSNEIQRKGYDMTSEEYDEFVDRYAEFADQAAQLETDYKKAAGGSSAPTDPSGLDFDAMTDEEIADILIEYGDLYYEIITGENALELYSDPTLYALVKAASEADDVATDAYSAYVDAYIDGKNTDADLEKFKNSTKAFVEAVAALQNAISANET